MMECVMTGMMHVYSAFEALVLLLMADLFLFKTCNPYTKNLLLVYIHSIYTYIVYIQ